MLVLAILGILLLIVGYLWYSTNKEYENTKKLLAQKTQELAEMVRNKNDSMLVIEQKTNELRELTNKFKSLQNDYDTQSIELAAARKALFDADDYILANYLGSNQEMILKLRRLRDVLLVIINNGQKFLCNRLSNHIGSQLKTLDTLTPDELSGKFSAVAWPVYPSLTDPVAQKNAIAAYNIALQSANTAQQELNTKLVAYSLISTLNVICTVDTTLIKTNMQRSLTMGDNAEIFGPREVLDYLDILEELILNIRNANCVNGRMDIVRIKEIYNKMLSIMCADDPKLLGLISKPLDAVVAKSVSMFLK